MRNRILIMVSCALLAASSALAQSAPRDPLSGNWARAGDTDGDGGAVLRLAYDGKGSVTGKVAAGRPSNLADVKSGSFDAKTGALRLEGDAKHPDTGAIVHFLITGTLTGDTLRAAGKFGAESGNVTLTRIAAKPSSAKRPF